MLNILNYFFLRKAKHYHIEKILQKENFIYTKIDIDNILKGNQKGLRYGNIVLKRKEGDETKDRFLKIVLDGKYKTFKLFSRQIKVADYIHKDKKITLPTISVMGDFLSYPVPYAIFETRDSGDNFGFMDDTQESYNNFTEQDVHNLVDLIYAFHESGSHIDPDIWNYTQNIHSSIDYYENEFSKFLNIKIIHKKNNGDISEEKVSDLLTTYSGISNIEDKIFKILRENWVYVSSSRKMNINYLVHADMQIDNVYKSEGGNFELLDFEWVGKSDNPVVAIMYDYGNLRARAWSSPGFQSMLDKYILEIGTKYYKVESLVRAGMNLGALRSSLMMCRYHLDFKNTVKNDKRTEQEYQDMYPKTLDSLLTLIRK